MKEIEETKELCGKIFIKWFLDEKENPSMEYTEKDKEIIEQCFIAKVLLKKFEVFDIKIHLPVHLLLILSLCTNDNPGMVQIILKVLLLSIKKNKGPISEGYVIKQLDFATAFPFSFPLIDDPVIYKKYEKLWDEQKIVDSNNNKCNLCDTIEWWKEVMK